MNNDLLGIILTVGWVLTFLVTSEFLAHKGKISSEVARKIIHISVGQVIFFLPIFDTWWIAAGIPLLFTFGNFFLSPVSPIPKMRLKTFEAGHAYGTILYPLSLAIVTSVFFNNPDIVILAFFPLVFGDGLAAVTGKKYKSRVFNLYNGEKTLIGTLTVFVASLISIVIGAYVLSLYIPTILVGETLFIWAAGISLLATGVEFLTPKGLDNLTIPLFAIMAAYSTFA